MMRAYFRDGEFHIPFDALTSATMNLDTIEGSTVTLQFGCDGDQLTLDDPDHSIYRAAIQKLQELRQ